jgi:lysophospholipase L1-like esterase
MTVTTVRCGRLLPWVLVCVGAVTVATSAQAPSSPPSPRIEPSTHRPHLSVTRFLAFGDSLTLGALETPTAATLTHGDDYPSRLRVMLASRYGDQEIRVVNAGRGGEMTRDGLARLPQVLRVEGPEVLLLLEGTNDLVINQAGIDPAIDAIGRMIDLADARGIRTLIGNLPPQRTGAPRAWESRIVPAYNLRLDGIAHRRGWHLVDINRAFDNLAILLGRDGLHPTVAGYQRIAETFFAAIRELFESPVGTKPMGL